jgi:hypothetical protein
MHHLAKRLRRPAVVVAPSPAPPQPVTVVEDEPPEPPPKPVAKAQPKPSPPKPPKRTTKKEAHPLEPLIKRLSSRVGELGLRGYEFRIAERKNPMFQFELGILFVAGKNERLRSLALHAQTESPWLPAAIDALAAHVVSVLNIALTDVTDATEIDALQLLLVNQRSAGPPRSRRSS